MTHSKTCPVYLTKEHGAYENVPSACTCEPNLTIVTGRGGVHLKNCAVIPDGSIGLCYCGLVEPKKCKCGGELKMMVSHHCNYLNGIPVISESEKNNESWEEEFDKKFPKSRHTSDIYPREELKSFYRTKIEALLGQQEKDNEKLREFSFGKGRYFERQTLKDHEEKYQELIMSVAKKYEGETRHETALRYIKQAESSREVIKLLQK